MRRSFVVLALLLIGACSASIPSEELAGTPLPAGELGSPAPIAIVLALQQRGEGFVPLPESQAWSVRVTLAQARAVAVASGSWSDAGFSYLGLWTDSWDPHESQPQPQPAYLVQVTYGDENAFVVIDATTGQVVSTSSPCYGPACSIALTQIGVGILAPEVTGWPTETLLLDIGGLAWTFEPGMGNGVVLLPTTSALRVRMLHAGDCSAIVAFTAKPDKRFYLHFAEDGSASVEDLGDAPIMMGPGIGDPVTSPCA